MVWYSLFLSALSLLVGFEIGRHFNVKTKDRLDLTDAKIEENSKLLHLLHERIEPVATGILPQATIDQADAQVLLDGIIRGGRSTSITLDKGDGSVVIEDADGVIAEWPNPSSDRAPSE